jgi:hypothetical protein
MARKKIAPPPKHFPDKFYAYYDIETKQLLSVTNQKITLYKDYLEIDFNTYEKLVTGKEKFSDYLLGLVDEGCDTSLQIVRIGETAPKFKNTMLEVVTESPNDNPELLVEWHETNKVWNFFLSPDGQARLKNKTDIEKLLFFVILETDYNFLIRTIIIDKQKLCVNECVGISFEHNLELDISKISIATTLVFRSKQLRIAHDNN